LDDEDNKWDYCPSVPTALALFALFGLSTLVHFFQACRFRKGFCWVLIMGGLWETLSFAARLYSMHKPTESGPYDASFLLLIISPILINAFDYMVLGRMINFFLPQGTKVAGIKGSWVGKIFVCCDILWVMKAQCFKSGLADYYTVLSSFKLEVVFCRSATP
jgi:hypothetical protein